MQMIMCVIHDPEKLAPVLEAWDAIGITGVTIIESSGLHRHREKTRIPMRYSFTSSEAERGNITLFSAVEQEAMIEACLQATEKVLGDLDNPNTGVFFVLPISMAKGLSNKKRPGTAG